MKNGNSYKDREYDIVPYDPNWPNLFNEYATTIKKIFGNGVQVEHFGSTSVPGMSGKFCIDVLVIVEDLNQVNRHAEELVEVGFIDAGQFLMEGSHLFRAMKGNELLANVHFFIKGHPHIKEMLVVRDYLKSHPDEVKAYSDLKLELKYKYPTDYASYRKYKDMYVKDLIKRANTATG